VSLRLQERVLIGLIGFVVFVVVAYLFGMLLLTWQPWRREGGVFLGTERVFQALAGGLSADNVPRSPDVVMESADSDVSSKLPGVPRLRRLP
jgi:hypothetical protein